jgi:hypothetical protein
MYLYRVSCMDWTLVVADAHPEHLLASKFGLFTFGVGSNVGSLLYVSLSVCKNK